MQCGRLLLVLRLEGDWENAETRMTGPELLRAHDAEFRKEVIKLNACCYLAVGYAASNVGMIVGDGGLIIIDTTESTQAAENILVEFRKISNLPVKAIIYTHGHRDHISGSTVLSDGGQPEIIAHARFVNDLREGDGQPWPLQILQQRTKRQFGIGLSQGTERINLGIGPGDRPLEGLGAGYIAPTRYIEGERQQIEIAGIVLTLIAAPGETPDHMVVWLERHKVLFGGDNYYKSFPNLYAIRGTRFRDFNVWAESLDRMLALEADILAPGHTRPLIGSEIVRQTLTDYRDAIRYVVDKTIEGMNLGLGPDELPGYVTLPPHLRDAPFLQEFYGTVDWAVRALYAGLLGWFDGNPTNLFPHAPLEKARRISQLAGGTDRLREAMVRASGEQDHQWVMELADTLLTLGLHVEEAKSAKKRAMLTLADKQMNAPARNYYLLSAKELE
jgi:alkyl sulfatase BDS1-like metallo-beta-lactamase superfamily hydrolase